MGLIVVAVSDRSAAVSVSVEHACEEQFKQLVVESSGGGELQADQCACKQAARQQTP
jgi:hypothetical protein